MKDQQQQHQQQKAAAAFPCVEGSAQQLTYVIEGRQMMA